MCPKIKSSQFNNCIVLNSLVYFLIAYYLVVFSFNLFSMAIAYRLGFDVELFYYGFTHAGKKWTTDNVILVFFVGNAFTLVTAGLFELLYRKQRKYSRGIKIFYMWVYLISLIWFAGNIIVGAFFNFGIGTAMRFFGLPAFLRLLLALITIAALVYFGYLAQKHVRVSANLYLPKLDNRSITSYFLHQIVFPAIIGIAIIILLKIPHLGMYHYVDIYLLLSFGFFIAGLFFRHRTHGSIRFISHGGKKKHLKVKSCRVSYFPLIIMIIILAVVRIGLMNGITF